jgi:hypothetical protein
MVIMFGTLLMNSAKIRGIEFAVKCTHFLGVVSGWISICRFQSVNPLTTNGDSRSRAGGI